MEWARPRRSMREGVQAPVARMVRSAVIAPRDVVFAPRIFRAAVPLRVEEGDREEKMRDVASSVMKETRFVASTRNRSHFMPSSASAQPERVLMYPQSPLPPPVPTAASISFLPFNSLTDPSSPLPFTMPSTFS